MYRSQDLVRNIMESNLKIVELLQKSSLSESEKKEKLDGLRQTMLKCCEVESNIKKYEICESELTQRRTPTDFENNKDFAEFLKDLHKSKEDVRSHTMYRKLEEKINAGEDEEDDEMRIEGPVHNFICPVSKRVMKNPMTNKLCGHCYDKSSVLELLKMNHKKGIRCPVAGCVKALKFTLSDLEPNDALKKAISQQKQ